MSNQTDVEQIVNRNHEQVVSQNRGGQGWRSARRMKLLKWASIFTVACGLSLLLQAVGQMGELLTTAVFMGCLSAAMFFLGRYAEFRSSGKK